MFQIDCPHCGLRPVTEFRFGGELTHRPRGGDLRQWADYVYNRENVAGTQTEWWYHRAGCQRWFKARRDTVTNQVLEIL